MMLIEIIKSTVCGGNTVKVGDKIKADPREGKLLVHMGKAIEVRETLTLKAEPMQDSQIEKPKSSKKKTKRKSKDKEE